MTQKVNHKNYPEKSYRFFIIAVIFLFLVIVFRLFQIQVINSSKYKAQAREQQWKSYILQARRGDILTSDGYPVATSDTRYDLFLDVKNYKKENDLFGMLSPIIPDLDRKKFDESLGSNLKWIRLYQNININQKKSIEELNIKGLVFNENYSRIYPEGSMLSHVLGFVGRNKEDDQVGYYGLEQYYDGYLQGQPGWFFQEKSAKGDPILWGDTERIEPKNGSSLYLTIDRNVQFLLDKKIEAGVKRYGAKSGTAIVVDPNTGAILGMSSYPSFVPSDYSEQSEIRNPAISILYEPGSVMKPLTMSSAVDMGKVNPNTIYNDTGAKYFSGHKVDNWDGKHHGEETMTEILQHSNNLGIAWVGQQVGDKKLMEYFRKFGLGDKTGIDLEDEESGVLYNKFPMKDIETVNASFGQGISLTPIQLVMAFSAIANDGVLQKPFIVKKISSYDGEVEVKPATVGRVISRETSATMRQMLTDAVSGGEAKFFVSKKYKIAGKTGTAQVPVKGGYDENRTNATFVGFFPSYRNFVMLVKLEEPVFPSGYSAETAVPLWMEISEELANYYGLLPDK